MSPGRIISFFYLVSLFPVTVFAQAEINSPYSRFGLGDQERQGFTRNSGMGGITVGMRDGNFIDYVNPASFGARDSLSFLFEFGMVGAQSEISTRTVTTLSKDINFRYLAVAFPVTKWLGVSAGVVPFTSVKYEIANQVREGDPDYNPNTGGVDYLYRGLGGVHRFYLGGGVNLYKGLSAGVSLSYIFGNMERARSITFIEQENYFNTKISENSLVGDVYLDLGLQYTLTFSEEYKIILGAVYTNERKINAELESFTENLLFNPQGGYYVDTVDYVAGITGKMQFPRSIGAGFTFRKGDQLVAGIDYYWQNWEEARFFGRSDSLVNSSSFHGGLEFTPNRNALRNYLSRINYRIGGYYTNTYLELKGEQLKDFGISFGLGLPLKRTRSAINLSFEMGKRGTMKNELIEEKYGIICFSLTLYDIWFMKRKFD